MPGFDRTGPRGRGSMTGRGFGYCRPTFQNEPGGNVREENSETGEVVNQQGSHGPIVYGLGKGGVPCGCGRGFGGGRRRGRFF